MEDVEVSVEGLRQVDTGLDDAVGGIRKVDRSKYRFHSTTQDTKMGEKSKKNRRIAPKDGGGLMSVQDGLGHAEGMEVGFDLMDAVEEDSGVASEGGDSDGGPIAQGEV